MPERRRLADRVHADVVVDGRRGRWRRARRACRGGSGAPSKAGPAGAEHAHRRRASRAAPRRWCRCRRRRAGRRSRRSGGERDGHRVGADEAGDERQEAHPRLGRDLQEQLARGKVERVPHHRRVGREADVARDRCRAGCGACTCCRRRRPCRSTWRARRTPGRSRSMCWLRRPTIRVWSLRRLPGLNWAKAIRDMRSPPKTAWGLRLETDASCSPDSSSISVVTTLVVPTSIARPNRMAVVSPRSTARTRPGRTWSRSPRRRRRAGPAAAPAARRPDVGGG